MEPKWKHYHERNKKNYQLQTNYKNYQDINTYTSQRVCYSLDMFGALGPQPTIGERGAKPTKAEGRGCVVHV